METFNTAVIPCSGLWSWSKAQQAQPLLAVASGSNAVAIYTAEGEPWRPAKGGVRNIRGTPAVGLAWQPTQPLLAIAWQDGAVSMWDAARRHLEEDSKTHRQPISHLVWHPSGKLFLTADVQGKVAIWEINKQKQPVSKCSVTEKGSTITHVVWAAGISNSTTAAYYAVSTAGSGTVTLKSLDDQGHASIVQDIGEGLVCLLFYEERNQLVAVTNSGSAIVLAGSTSTGDAAGSGLATEWSVLMRVKVANTTAGAGLQVCWACSHTLALASSQDPTIRLLQLDTDDNYVLDVSRTQFVETGDTGKDQQAKAAAAAGIVGLVYEPVQQVLAAATAAGKICLFKHWASKAAGGAAASDPAAQWEPLQSFWVGSAPFPVAWGSTSQVLAANCADGLYLCKRSLLHHKLSSRYAAMQVAAGRVLVEQLDSNMPPAVISVSLQLAGLDVTDGALLLHDGQRAEVYRISDIDGSISVAAQFEVPSPSNQTPAAGTNKDGAAAHDSGAAAVTVGDSSKCCMALHGDRLFRTAEDRVEVCNWTGVVGHALPFDAAQGRPMLLDANHGFLAVLTSKALVRVFNLGNEVKPHAGPGPIIPAKTSGSLQIDSIRVSCDGSMVCALASLPGGGCQDPRLFVYCAGTNSGLMLDFSQDLAAPKAAMWDMEDPRLLAVHTGALMRGQSCSSRPSSGANTADGSTAPDKGGSVRMERTGDIAVVFATADAGLILQEYQDLDPGSSGAAGFLGVCAPHLLLYRGSSSQQQPPQHGRLSMLMQAGSSSSSSSSMIVRVPLRCFDGIADADDDTRRALLDFNYYLAVGKLEEAFRAVAALKSPAVWRSMAHMAIKNKRLDVAEHCLGNMEHVRGARALREGADLPELDARIGLVAVQLGLIEDAARLFAGCQRWDLLEQLQAASGGWDDALQTAAKQDRVRLRSVQHACARHHELLGDLKAAMQHYSASGTAAKEVPRMLWQHDDMAELERQVLSSGDAGLLVWWARACEASGNYQQALSCYQRAGNQLAALRIHCATGDWDAAEQLVATTQDPAAAFHLARLYEAQDKVADALRCYSTSKRYSHGARLAKRCNMDQELMSFALKSSQAIMLEAADHLLAGGNSQAAALLYQRGGKLGKAVDMALSAGLVDVLDSIAGQLDQDADPQLMARCAEALVSAGHHDQAVRLLVKARQPEHALDLLVAKEVPLTDELAEALTPEKLPDNADSRSAVLLRIAQAAKAQGLYHLACKKYTQAGDRLKAMRALIKSGDNEKIIFFAGVSRQREVYIMAANYLQTLNWRARPEVLNNIITFYTKAGAADSLAHFYMGCAQAEIDQFKSYDKALQAMQEASKHLARSRATDREAQMEALQAASQRVVCYIEAHSMLEQDPAAAVTICQQLLHEVPQQQSPQPDVRPGDVYGLLVGWCYDQGNMQQAMQLVEQMLDSRLQPHQFLNPTVLTALQQAAGAGAFARAVDDVHNGRAGADGGDEVVQEDLPYLPADEDVDDDTYPQ